MSLPLLSESFSVSLDQLVKGDIETMKKEINAQEIAEFQKGQLNISLFIVLIVSPIPIAKLFGWWGMAAYLIIIASEMYYAIRVERHKKRFDIQTYREIEAFSEGECLDEIE